MTSGAGFPEFQKSRQNRKACCPQKMRLAAKPVSFHRSRGQRRLILCGEGKFPISAPYRASGAGRRSFGRSIKMDGFLGIVQVLKNYLHLGFRDPGDGQWRQFIFRKETDGACFDALRRLAADDFALDQDFINMERGWRMGMKFFVKYCQQLDRFYIISRFFLHLFHGHFPRRVSDVGPTAG